MKNKKQIGFVIHHIENKGGEERMCSLIANYLVENGYDVTIISLWTENGTKIFHSLSPKVKLRYIMNTKIIVRINHWFPWMKVYQRRLRDCIRKSHLDILIDVDTICTPETTVALQGLSVKHVAWDHFCYSNFELKHIRRLPYLQNGIDRLVVLTKDDLRDYITKAKINPSIVTQIYNPSPIAISNYICHDTKKVLAVGRLEEQKGFDRLLNIWARIEKQNEDWELEIVGDGSKKDFLKELAEANGLKRVFFSQSTSSIIEKYKGASIFVLTSKYEGFPLVLLEALNASLPVVSFDCDNGPREIIQEGINGYLIRQGDESLFADKLLALMNDESLRKKISLNCKDSVKQFDLESIGKQWISLIAGML